MREIYFRGKDLDGNWREGDLIWATLGQGQKPMILDAFDEIDIGNNLYEVAPDTVGQFTGLYDAEGREIYEGDIIKVIVVAKTPKWDFQRNFVVEWSVDGWYMEGDPLHVWILLHTLKVIGNVHDNPGLLEVEHDRRD